MAEVVVTKPSCCLSLAYPFAAGSLSRTVSVLCYWTASKLLMVESLLGLGGLASAPYFSSFVLSSFSSFKSWSFKQTTLFVSGSIANVLNLASSSISFHYSAVNNFFMASFWQRMCCTQCTILSSSLTMRSAAWENLSLFVWQQVMKAKILCILSQIPLKNPTGIRLRTTSLFSSSSWWTSPPGFFFSSPSRIR